MSDTFTLLYVILLVLATIAIFVVAGAAAVIFVARHGGKFK